ncbi:MAG: MBL fold metallo-hydrolase, partial [Clostridia bacterium]|nr:MBL fold metallo-hydrolase [Clostridia bacterium]
MNVITIPTGTMQANCYIVETENSAVIIDPGFLERDIEKYIAENPDKVKYILLTHRHFDHINGAVKVRNLTGTKIVINELDEGGLYSDMLSLSSMVGGIYGKADPDAHADIHVSEGDTVTVGDMVFTVMETPGHTEGGVCYVCDNVIFSGDTLFKGSIGRTDFPSSSNSDMRKSLDRLCLLPDET